MLQLQNLFELQELSKFSNWAHNAEHKVDHDLHHVNWKGLGIGAWHGLTWCYSDDKCHAAVEKYGSKAVEDGAEAAEKEELMELSRFSNWAHKEEGHIKADFKKIDWKDLGAGAWQGVTACYSNEKCKAAVAKYGLHAVEDAGEDAVEVAALMNLHESGAKRFFTGGDNKAMAGFFEGKDDKKIDNAFKKSDAEIKKLALGAWHGVTACFQSEKCRAAIKKFGTKAVEDVGEVGEDAAEVAALQNLSGFSNWVHKEEGHVKHDFHDAGKEIKHLGLGAWHSTEHCYSTPKCKDAVEKYGLIAVKAAMIVGLAPVGALQNMIILV